MGRFIGAIERAYDCIGVIQEYVKDLEAKRLYPKPSMGLGLRSGYLSDRARINGCEHRSAAKISRKMWI